MRKRFKIIGIITIMGLLVSPVNAQSLFKSMNLLATHPFSMENRGQFSRKPACRKLQKLIKKLNIKVNRMKNDYMDTPDESLMKSIIDTSKKSFELKKKLYKKCRTRTAKAVHGGFKDTVRKLQIELRSREVPVSVFQYPTPADLEGKGQIELKIEERTVILGQLLQDVENTQELILSLYKKSFSQKPASNKPAASKTASPDTKDDLDDLDDLDDMDDMEEDAGKSEITSEEYEVIANVEMRSLFKNMYDLHLTDGQRHFVPEPLKAPQEVEDLDLVFSHYYHIRKESRAKYTLRIHIFFMDTTQPDENTKSYPVYSKTTNPMPWKGRKTDYVGNLSKELNLVAEQFAVKH
jgi:hypothetical protein